jgi:acyl-CoA reductase-like NAD-dependent aldehyde dehydrogenase
MSADPRADISAIVQKVLQRIQSGDSGPPSLPDRDTPPERQRGVFATVDEAVDAAEIAQAQLVELPLEKRREIIANIRRRCAEGVHTFAEMAHSETGLGRAADKITKNLLVIHKTPGPEILQPSAFSGDNGLTLVERAPYGVIAAITPSTNPTETIINNGIGMVSGGNSVAFNVHPGAKRCSAWCIDLINRAVMEVGGPENVMTCVASPTIASANNIMRHKKTGLVVVTGGGAVVKSALSSGKRCVAGGPGNPPVVVDQTADLDRAARGIVRGASLDNNIICVDEKEVFAVEGIFDDLMDRVEKLNCVRLRHHQIRRLEKLVLAPDGKHVNREWIGKDAGKMLKEIDVHFRGDPRLVVCEVPFEHPFVQLEMLMPVLPFVRATDTHQAIDLAVEAEHGYRHTAVMYSRDLDALHRMARAFDGSIFVKNAPSVAGLGYGGEGFTSFTIASPTGDGLTTARTFTRERRCTLAGYFRIV